MKIWTMLAAAGAMLFATAGQAATSVFDFRGTCSDCTGFGVGRLTLQDYAYGSQINNANFVSFAYNGSNLYPAFTITQANAQMLSGSIASAQPGGQTVFFYSAANYFRSSTDGAWRLGNTGELSADFGTNGIYTLAVAPAVPEPAAWALMIGGFGLAGAALRRRAKVSVRVRFA